MVKNLHLRYKTRWLDYGPDEYAGITWSNTGNRKIFLGWMSNWQYANQVPTKTWRNAMTIPRELKIKQSKGGILLASKPVVELKNIHTKIVVLKQLQVNKTIDLSSKVSGFKSQYVLKLNLAQLKNYSIKLSNKNGEELLIGYEAGKDQYYIDRTKAGKTDFQKNFAGRFTAPG